MDFLKSDCVGWGILVGFVVGCAVTWMCAVYVLSILKRCLGIIEFDNKSLLK